MQLADYMDPIDGETPEETGRRLFFEWIFARGGNAAADVRRWLTEFPDAQLFTAFCETWGDAAEERDYLPASAHDMREGGPELFESDDDARDIKGEQPTKDPKPKRDKADKGGKADAAETPDDADKIEKPAPARVERARLSADRKYQKRADKRQVRERYGITAEVFAGWCAQLRAQLRVEGEQ